ncbi:hypothetical protein [Nitrosomonas oligotropha]|uniref:hypothetical protein n=1 Tax=Nitrosomonas oligotropha TaxID=42354 RepID=UPI001C431695|nr:hypothetical protein [Nitrosomonas oligotropha]
MHAWITAIARYDEQALAELYEATLARVYGIALRITCNPQAAEEVSERMCTGRCGAKRRASMRNAAMSSPGC